MLGRKARPVIGNLMTGTSGSGFKPGVYDVIRSTKIPLDLIKIQSPRGLKNYGAAGVGLGIVAALEKTLESSVIQIHATKALYNQSSVFKNRGHAEESEEDYTYVTSYGPNKRSHTRVYYDGCENSRKGSDRRSVKSHRVCVFDISPAITSSEVASSDFLSSCHMCQKKLHGEDIYMYRGEKAYCSTECRERQMVMDEKKENKFCSSRDVSTSPYTNDYQMFTTGIFAI